MVAMRPRNGLILTLVVLAGCLDGKPNDALVGKWKTSEVYGGDTWQFKSDGSFSIQGGQRKSFDDPAKLVPNLPRSGTWAEKVGALTLKYDSQTEPKVVEYRWKKSDHRLHLTEAGHEAPAVILERMD